MESHGILLGNEKEGTVDVCNNLNRYPENYALKEKTKCQCQKVK